jgi:hypothetical protein
MSSYANDDQRPHTATGIFVSPAPAHGRAVGPMPLTAGH